MENFGKKGKMMMEDQIDDEALLLDNPVKYWLDRSRKAMLEKGMRVLRVPAAPPSLPPGAISHKKVVRLLCVDLICDNCGTFMPRDMYVHAIDYCYPKDFNEREKIGCYVACSQCASDIVLGRDVDNRKFARGATAHNPILIGHPWGVRLRTICVQSGVQMLNTITSQVVDLPYPVLTLNTVKSQVTGLRHPVVLLKISPSKLILQMLTVISQMPNQWKWKSNEHSCHAKILQLWEETNLCSWCVVVDLPVWFLMAFNITNREMVFLSE